MGPHLFKPTPEALFGDGRGVSKGLPPSNQLVLRQYPLFPSFLWVWENTHTPLFLVEIYPKVYKLSNIMSINYLMRRVIKMATRTGNYGKSEDWKYQCKRCGYSWRPRGAFKPVSCPKCKSYRWDSKPERWERENISD